MKKLKKIQRLCKHILLLVVLWLVAAVHAYAQNINIPNKTGPMGLEVNTLTGNLFFTRNDLYIPARGFSMNISFHYNSFNFDSNVGYGNGWSFDYNIKYSNDTAGGKIITWGDGREDSYRSAGGSAFISPRGFFTTLAEYQPGKYSITETDGTKYFFDNSTHKRITRMEDHNGNFINFSYTDTLLASITNGAGQTISFAYTNGRLTTVTDAMTAPTRTFTYLYDGAGNLKEVKDPLNNSTKYAYLVNGPMKNVSDKNNNKVDIIYFNDFSISELIGCNKRLSFSYDTATLTTVVTDYLDDGNNQVTKYEFKKQEGSTWLSGMLGNCCGFNMKFEFDNNGNKIKETDANDNVTRFTYDSRGNMLTMTDALNQVVTYTYTPDYNKIASFKDENGSITTMTYDSRGNLTQMTEPGNLVYAATYAANGDIMSSTDPKGNSFIYNYDSFGNPISVTGPGGFTAQLTYDTRGNLLSVTDAMGNSNSIEYDILGRLKKITDPSNSNIQVSYDAESNPVLFKNQNNEAINMAYDASNRPVEITDQVGGKTKVTYDAMDNLKSITNAGGNTYSLKYDNRNRLKKATDPEGNMLTTDYDANGNLTVLNMPNGQRVNYTYDALNRVTVVSDLTGILLKLSYDKNSNITSYTNSNGAVYSIEYDNLNRVKKLTDPLGNSYAPGYDNNSNVITLTDRNGFTSTYTYDSLNRVKTMTDNNGNTVTTTYDAASNPVAVKDQNNNITNYTYDNLNRLRRVTYPDGKYIENTYDSKSNIITRRTTDGSLLNFGYDILNRIISKTLPDGQVFTYTYDSLGRVVTASNNAGTVTLTYDALSRISSETFGGKTVNYSYNVSGRIQTTVYPNGTTVVKSYDTRNKLTSITQDTTVLATYQYNAAGQLVSKTMANGITTNYQYDFASRLSNISTSVSSIQNSSFIYNNEQQKTSINRLNNPAASEQFMYDNNGRLTNYKRGIIGGSPLVQNAYSYDALGNRTTANLNGTNTTYTSNNLNQLINSNSGAQNINFTYDNNGNLTYDGHFYKSYDAEGRLLKDSSSPANVVSYQYDAFSRRVRKNRNGNILNYTFSGLTPIEERDGAATLINKTIFAGFLKPVVNEKNNQRFFYHQNELNSVEAISNQQGRLLEKYQYDVYGKMSIYDSLNNPLAGSLAGNRFGFTGQLYDSATAQYNFFFREYNPETGLFNQRDLLGYADGMGMYQYVHNNPANGIDVLGLESGQVTLDEMQRIEQDRLREEDRKNPCNRIKTNLLKLVNEESTPYSLKDLLTDVKNIRSLTEQFRDLDSRTNFGALELMEETTKVPLSSLNKGLGNLLSLSTVLNDIGDFAVNGTNGKSNAEVLGTVVKDFSSSVKLVNTLASASPSTVEFLATTPKVSQFLKVGGEVAGAELVAVASILEPAITYSAEQYYSSNDGMLGLIIPKKNGDADLRLADRMPSNHTDQPFFRASRDQAMVDIEKRIAETNQKKRALSERYRREFIRRVASFLRKIGCPQNNGGGTQRPVRQIGNQINANVEAITSNDPNAIIGPDGQPDKHWVSVNDRLPYTILYENSEAASAPAKYVKITSPIEPKENPSTFQLGNFGFNSLSFSVPPNTASYYQRLDARDSLGLYVDVTAGYDQINNQAFWEFQAIDPVTLLPPADPLKGFLLLQDSSKPLNGHGFVNFSIKPVTSAITLDTIGARASIVFDLNDTIPTNIYKITIDAFAPVSHMNALSSNSSNPIHLSWTGNDDTGGCGIDYYTIYVSTDQVNFSVLIPRTSRTDTTISLPPDSNYCFFVLATDRVGNKETLRQGEIKCTYVGPPLPVTWLYFRGKTVAKDNILDWATANEQNSKQFDVERSLDGTRFGKIGVVIAHGNSSQTNTYQYTDQSIDRLGSELMFYRLKQIDIDGNYKYSSIVRLRYSEKNIVNSIVYPNPTQGSATILVGDNSLVGTQAILYDINGRLLESILITANSQPVNLNKYVNGIYFIKLNNKEVLKIIKQ